MSYFTGINEFLFHLFNGLAGRSWAFDSLASIIENNDLAKGGVIGACFIAAWYKFARESDKIQARRILIATLVASVVALAITKTLSHEFFYPRPYMLSQKLYHLEAGELVEFKTTAFNVPLDDTSQQIYGDFLQGRVILNHLGTFPSDNASFFIAICLGILLAYRSVGLLAMLWAIFGVLAVKIFSGKHFPLDILVGGAIAVVVFYFVKYAAEHPLRKPFTGLARWTIAHRALSGAVIFIVVFEIASTLRHLFPIIDFVSTVGRHLLGL
jgi:membrane-associated phospholipid phosphatase